MKSKLLLLDIFSYSCMNCLRSLKFIKKLDSKYSKFGLDTILVHPPEWGFEKSKKNILFAIKKYAIKFPILLDSNKKIIKKLKINFWPAQILIKNGEIIYKNIGEGCYSELENEIISYLNIRHAKKFREEPQYTKFPTMYLGKRKNGNVVQLKKGLTFGIIYKNGEWFQGNEYLLSNGKNSSLTILTKGFVINFVAGSMSQKSMLIKVKLNDKFIKNLKINKPQLYKITKLENNKPHKLTLTTEKGLAVYSFSFQ